MKIIITERQFKFIVKNFSTQILFENEEVILSIEQTLELFEKYPEDFLKNFNKFKLYLTAIAKSFKEKAKSRSYGHSFDVTMKNIEGETNINDELVENLQKFLLKIFRYFPEKRSILKRLLLLIGKLSNIEEKQGNLIDILKKINLIMDDERFEKIDAKKLYDFIIKDVETQNFEKFLNDFFVVIKNPSLKYEESFVHEDWFKLDRTSPTVDIILKSVRNEPLRFYNKRIDEEEFNSISTDIDKVLYLISCMPQETDGPYEKIYEEKSGEWIINFFLTKCNFELGDNYKIPKRDLTALQDIKPIRVDPRTNTVRDETIIKKGDGVEVKYRSTYTSYLSEFFKVDSTSTNVERIISALDKVKNVDSGRDVFKKFMEILVSRLYAATEGRKDIIINLTEGLSGIIFKNNEFIKSSNLKFEWCTKGYANKPRLAVCYDVLSTNPYRFKKSVEEDIFSKITGEVF